MTIANVLSAMTTVYDLIIGVFQNVVTMDALFDDVRN